MKSKGEIVTTLEESIKILTVALNEREELLRAFLRSNEVTKAEDLEDLESYRAGANLEEQIEELKDLLDELKYKIVRIGALKNF